MPLFKQNCRVLSRSTAFADGIEVAIPRVYSTCFSYSYNNFGTLFKVKTALSHLYIYIYTLYSLHLLYVQLLGLMKPQLVLFVRQSWYNFTFRWLTTNYSGSSFASHQCMNFGWWFVLRKNRSPTGCFQKWWYPTTMGFPTKNDHFGVFWGYPYFWKHLNDKDILLYTSIC